MKIVQQYAVLAQDDTLPDFVKVSREGERTFLVSGMASSVEDLVKMFNEAAGAMKK